MIPIAPKTPHIMFVCTEDWFFRSHFLPLHQAALSQGYRTTLVCNVGEAQPDLERQGIRVLPIAFSRESTNPFHAFGLLWQLARLFRQEKPDLIHFIALKPVLAGGLAALPLTKTPKLYHVTGMGTLAEGQSRLLAIVRQGAFRLVTFYLGRCKSFLMVENPDDLTFLRRYGKIVDSQVTLLGGAGVDPEFFCPAEGTKNREVHLAFVGRMIWTKGVDVLVQAHQLLAQKGLRLHLNLYGTPDPGNPKTVTDSTLAQWQALPNITWHGRTEDVRAVWAKADIAIVATRTREGMPRAMLEAAACGRSLIVTDIPGCRHFVCNGIEGLVVPPDDADALAKAIETLALSPKLREKMGTAARERVLDGYTEDDIKEKVITVYRAALE